MSRNLAVALIALTANIGNVAAQEQDRMSVTIAERVIPVPDTVSPALQKLMEQRWPGPPSHIPASAEEWKAFTAPTHDGLEQLAKLRAQFAVSIVSQVVGGVPCYLITPKVTNPRHRNRLLFGLHGGAFVAGAGESGLVEAIEMAGLTGIKVIAVDYRMPPEHPFPAAVDDAIAVWKETVKSVKPNNIALFGNSAGGALVLSVVQRAIKEGLPLPGAVFAGSPWSDLSKTGDSYYANAGVDRLLGTYEGVLAAAAKLYANGRDLNDPLISPVYGDFTGFPPTFLASGTRDLFLSNTVRVDQKLLDARVPTLLDVEEGQSHTEYLFAAIEGAPEGARLYSHIEHFLDTYLGSGKQ
jgi:monoterpene epsilon-lactone hydrolase